MYSQCFLKKPTDFEIFAKNIGPKNTKIVIFFRKHRDGQKLAHYAGQNTKQMQANVFFASQGNKINPKHPI